MKTNRKVRISFIRLSDQEFFALVYTVYSAMLENSHFVSPRPSLKALKASLDEFSLNLSISSRRGSPLDTETKNESRQNLAKLVTSLANYVNETANGKLSVLLSTGLPISKPSTRTQVPLRVDGLMLKDGRQRGQMVLSFNPQKRIKIYKYRYTDEISAEGEYLWTGEEFYTTSSNNNTIASLVTGKMYYISVQAINSFGIGDWSEPVSWIAR